MNTTFVFPDPDRGYIAPIFNNTDAIINNHHRYRLGHTNDLSDLIKGGEDDQRDYVIGAVVISIIILAFLLIWSIVLLILKCCGRKVGCAAGYPPTKPPRAHQLSSAGAKVVPLDERDTIKSPPEGPEDCKDDAAEGGIITDEEEQAEGEEVDDKDDADGEKTQDCADTEQDEGGDDAVGDATEEEEGVKDEDGDAPAATAAHAGAAEGAEAAEEVEVEVTESKSVDPGCCNGAATGAALASAKSLVSGSIMTGGGGADDDDATGGGGGGNNAVDAQQQDFAPDEEHVQAEGEIDAAVGGTKEGVRDEDDEDEDAQEDSYADEGEVEEGENDALKGTNEKGVEGNDKDVDDVTAMQEQDYDRQLRRFNRRILSTRIIFLVCAVIVLVATILTVVDGFGSLNKSFEAALESVEQVENICNAGITATDTFLNSTAQASMYMAKLRGIESNLSGTCLSSTSFPTEDIESLSSALQDFTAHTVSEAQDVRSDLYEILNIAESIDTSVNSMGWALYVVLAAAIIVILMTLIFCLGVILAWVERSPRPFRCIQSYAVLPIFIFFLVINTISCAAFIIGGLVGADFCFNSPDSNVVAVVEENSYLFSSVVYQLILYYVQGCPSSLIPPTLLDYAQDALRALASTQSAIDALSQVPADEWSSACGVDQSTVINLVSAIDLQLRTYLGAIVDVRVIFSCASFNPVYVSLMYDAVCYNGIDAFERMFRSLLAVAIAGMVMVTLRVSWRQVEEAEEVSSGKNRSRCAGCACRK